MTKETKERIIRAMEGQCGAAIDNAVRARAASRRAHSAAEAALFREYEREAQEAQRALNEAKEVLS